MLTLCTLGPLCHAWLFLLSFFLLLHVASFLAGVRLLISRSLPGGPGPPSPPSPGLTPFPSDPRQHPTPP